MPSYFKSAMKLKPTITTLTQNPTLRRTASRFAVASAALVLAFAGLTGCDKKGDAGSSSGAPAVKEGKVEAAKLDAIGALLPAEVGEWKKQARLGHYISDTVSTATATYAKASGGPTFSISVTISSTIVGQSKSMIADPKKADTLGFQVGKFADLPALLAKPDSKNISPITVVVSDSRSVSIMMSPTSGLTLDVVKPVFEKVDFKGIASK